MCPRWRSTLTVARRRCWCGRRIIQGQRRRVRLQCGRGQPSATDGPARSSPTHQLHGTRRSTRITPPACGTGSTVPPPPRRRAVVAACCARRCATRSASGSSSPAAPSAITGIGRHAPVIAALGSVPLAYARGSAAIPPHRRCAASLAARRTPRHPTQRGVRHARAAPCWDLRCPGDRQSQHGRSDHQHRRRSVSHQCKGAR